MDKWKNIWRWERLEDLPREELYNIIIEFGEQYRRNSGIRLAESIKNINKLWLK